MPELPEVESVVRSLRGRLEGRTLVAGHYRTSRVFRGEFPGPALEGAQITAVRRHGKHIVVETTAGLLAIHLGMTGKLLFDVPQTAYTRAVWQVEGAGQRQEMVYEDVRQFGRISFGEELPPHIAELGPDPLEVTAAEFLAGLQGRKCRVKPLLLDQHFLRGVGNIYADEALFRAGIHPQAVAGRIRSKRAEELWRAVQEVLQEAIAAGGSSISDYVDAEGRTGSFQERHQVYGREGEPCRKCGQAITKIFLAQRGTHFCAACQRR